MTLISLDEFFSDLDKVVAPIIAISKLVDEHREEMKDLGIVKDPPSPKWARRKKGEKRASDRWDYGEKVR